MISRARWLLFFVTPLLAPAQVELQRLPDRVRITVEGRLFTEYIFKGADRPYCYPVPCP